MTRESIKHVRLESLTDVPDTGFAASGRSPRMNANRDLRGPGRLSAVLAAGLLVLISPSSSRAQAPAGAPAARMTVTGRVLDPQGRPVPNAAVMVYAQTLLRTDPTPSLPLLPAELGHGTADGAGRFRVEVPRIASTSHEIFAAVALAPGYGAGWVGLNPDADQPTADIALRPERIIRGRLFDLKGQPARDVKLSVTAIRRVLPKRPDDLRETFEGPQFWWAHPDDLPAWPSPAITGADGRFTLRGVGTGVRLFVSVLDPRFTSELIDIDTDTIADEKPLSLVLQPARTLTGRVTFADTGKPVPHARVIVSGFEKIEFAVAARPVLTETDAEGRFRANAGPGAQGYVVAVPPDGEVYPFTFTEIVWPKGAVTHSVDLALRGVMMRGKVTESGSGRPVSGAIVGFISPRPASDQGILPRGGPVETGADGSFAFPVLARSGYLVVWAPSDDYVLQELDRGRLFAAQPSGRRIYAHAYLACDPRMGDEDRNVTVALCPGVTVKGGVVGPDGQPVADAWLISRIHLSPLLPTNRIWSGDWHGTARHGQFELHGLDSDAKVPVSFFEPHRKLGATVRFSGKSAHDEPITVRLAPCGQATARLIGPDGKPLAGFAPPSLITMVVTPGEFSFITVEKKGTSFADEATLPTVDPIHYEKEPTTDTRGRLLLPVLIPGALYRIVDRTTTRDPGGPLLRKEFTVKPGETLDLGDVRIQKPPRR